MYTQTPLNSQTRCFIHLLTTYFLILGGALIFGPASADQDTSWALEKTGVETADDVWLATDIYLPGKAAGQKLPAVLIRTPYGRYQFRKDEPLVDLLIAEGLAVVIQDARGKWGSTGEFRPFVDERRDGLATLDWIVEQPWSSGAVGMWGSSYPAFNALILLPAAHPALRTIFSISGWLDGRSINRPGGAYHLMLGLPWLLQQETERTRSTADFDLEQMFSHLPLIDAFRSVGLSSAAWRDPSILEPPSHDMVKTPPRASVFHVTGWYDFVAGSSLDVYRQLAGAGVRQKLWIGPWQHNQVFTDFTSVGEEELGPASALGAFAVHQLAARWFAAELLGQAGAEDPRDTVHVFMMGENAWHDFDAWPPPRASTVRWYLSAGDTGGLLVDQAVNVSTVRDPLPTDPMDPVPTWGGANFHLFGEVSGVLDQRPIEQRPDVLTYTSAPLDQPLVIAGPVQAQVQLSTEKLDADLVAKLVVVRPDGYARLVTDGIVRASFVHGPLTPGKPYTLNVDLGDAAIHVASGERLRLQLAGSNFPKFDRNPHSGVDSRLATELLAVRHTVHSTPEQSSFLELTVLPQGPHIPTHGPRQAEHPCR